MLSFYVNNCPRIIPFRIPRPGWTTVSNFDSGKIITIISAEETQEETETMPRTAEAPQDRLEYVLSFSNYRTRN